MNDGNNWSAMAVVTTLGWVSVGTMIVGMWLALWVGHDPLAQALGFTGCASSAVAAVAQIRRYTCRVMNLIRALHSADELTAIEARPLTPIR